MLLYAQCITTRGHPALGRAEMHCFQQWALPYNLHYDQTTMIPLHVLLLSDSELWLASSQRTEFLQIFHPALKPISSAVWSRQPLSLLKVWPSSPEGYTNIFLSADFPFHHLLECF